MAAFHQEVPGESDVGVEDGEGVKNRDADVVDLTRKITGFIRGCSASGSIRQIANVTQASGTVHLQIVEKNCH